MIMFILNSILLGTGLAMDAFSVSMANGLNDPHMSEKGIARIAGTFAFFQWLMPMLGWIAVCWMARVFSVFEKAVPWIALILLGFIGGKMIWEGMHQEEEQEAEKETHLGSGTLFLQGIATSIDALSVGFTIADYQFVQAFSASVIIAAVTYVICTAGVHIGQKFGMKLADKASVFGGLILVCIGLEIFIRSLL